MNRVEKIIEAAGNHGWAIISVVLILVLTSPGVFPRAARAQAPAAALAKKTAREPISISSYDDDAFVDNSVVEKISSSGFERGAHRHPILSNGRVKIEDEDFIFRADRETGEFLPFANNPWPAPTSNRQGDFRFPREERFPLHEVVRGPDGQPILDPDGLQQWLPRNLHLGSTTAFEAANSARDAAEFWSGRDIAWGNDNLLEINAHAFVDFNAFYSPAVRSLFFGVVPYRLPGETVIKMFEMASGWEIAAHESGHALHHVLKPNVDNSDLGFRQWGESFADQMAMWTGMRDPDRQKNILKETEGNLFTSNHLSAIGEVFASLVGEGTALRDAFHNKTVSDTDDEVHDRSEVLTGAAYKIFERMYVDFTQNQGMTELQAIRKASDQMGLINTWATDFTPENTMTLDDVGKAYLKVDKEFFGSQYHIVLVNELTRREIFGADSVAEWLAHEAALPELRLPQPASEQAVDGLVQANLDNLGIGPDFGLILQSVTSDRRFKQTIVRVQLTEGRGSDAPLFDNHGILTFRADGTLADYHSPLPSDFFSHAQALALIDLAKQFGLHLHGAPLSIVRKPDGQLTVEARVMRGSGMNTYIEAFTLENPWGEFREIITPISPYEMKGYMPSGVQILTE
jgi:hypothetical protein